MRGQVIAAIVLTAVGLAIMLVVPTDYEGPLLLCINEQHAIRLADAIGLVVTIPAWLYLNVLVLRLRARRQKHGNQPSGVSQLLRPDDMTLPVASPQKGEKP